MEAFSQTPGSIKIRLLPKVSDMFLHVSKYLLLLLLLFYIIFFLGQAFVFYLDVSFLRRGPTRRNLLIVFSW